MASKDLKKLREVVPRIEKMLHEINWMNAELRSNDIDEAKTKMYDGLELLKVALFSREEW